MKLWIRTADNRGLYEVCGIRVEGVDVQTYDIIGFFNSKQVILGEYGARERCLEIIDEIQNLFVSNNKVLFKSVDISGLCQPKIILYQMPEE